MAESVPGAVLRQLTKSLEAVGQQLALEPVPRDALVDFKTAVDHIRLSAWALLDADVDAPGSAGTAGMIAQFRLIRANELYSHLRDDLEAGRIPPESRDLRQLQVHLRDLADLVGQYVGNGT